MLWRGQEVELGSGAQQWLPSRLPVVGKAVGVQDLISPSLSPKTSKPRFYLVDCVRQSSVLLLFGLCCT